MILRRELLRASALAAANLLGACAADCVPQGRTAVSLWFSYGGTNRQVLESLVHRFNERQTRDYVAAVYQGDYFEGLAKLRTAIAAKCAPALSHVVGEVVPYLAEARVLEPLVDYPGVRELDVVPELGQERSWLGGGTHPLVALPFNRSTPIAYLNGELFAEAGLSAPRTWQELRAVAAQLTKPGPNTRFGFGCPINWWFWVALVGQAGGTVVAPDGRVSLGDDAGVQALSLWQELVRSGHMKPPPGRDYNAWEQCNQDFLAGRAAMIWSSTAFLKYLEAHAPFSVVAAPLPAQRAARGADRRHVLGRAALRAEQREGRGGALLAFHARARAGDRMVDPHGLHSRDSERGPRARSARLLRRPPERRRGARAAVRRRALALVGRICSVCSAKSCSRAWRAPSSRGGTPARS